ncbi:MAG TPA: M20/M25/M40 family metallo-hydrolase, partial [Blastocatellia bacterium]|nr:M20/M25/M40 family metallo-hydrolase [Blastocatellia bacterium]
MIRQQAAWLSAGLLLFAGLAGWTARPVARPIAADIAADRTGRHPDAGRGEIDDYRKSHEAAILAEMAAFLSIPNTASDSNNIERNALALVKMMKNRGIEARLIEGGGPPVVFGQLKAPGARRTIAIYAHYDGQPVGGPQWATPPFKPVLRDRALESGGKIIPFPNPGQICDPEWRVYARSASDDKAPIVSMMAALDAIRASKIPITSNLKFLFEGEEEAGSPHLRELLKRNTGLLGADVWICADGPVHQSGRPEVFFGCRGIVTATITVYGPNRSLHSGHYGNWAPNPAMRLVTLLAGMKDGRGHVLIDGFYDGIEPLGPEEREAIAQAPAIDAELMREFGLAQADGEGRTLAQLINEPSLNIDKISSGEEGVPARTVIPPEATATLDMRLVKGITPEQQLGRLEEYIRKQGYLILSREPDAAARLKNPLIARITSRDGYNAARTPMNLDIARKIVGAVETGTGRKPVLMPTVGGSTPMSIFADLTGIPQ